MSLQVFLILFQRAIIRLFGVNLYLILYFKRIYVEQDNLEHLKQLTNQDGNNISAPVCLRGCVYACGVNLNQ